MNRGSRISANYNQGLSANPRLSNSNAANSRLTNVDGPIGTNEDQDAALQNKLDDTADRDEAKIELRRLKKIVDQHRKILEVLEDDTINERTWDRIEIGFSQFEQELNKEKTDLTLDEISPRRTYEGLRSSLIDMQKRVSSLNTDTTQDVDCELQSLVSVKDSYKNLQEQIHAHTKTIAALDDDIKKMGSLDLSRRFDQRGSGGHYKYSHQEHSDRLNDVKARAIIINDELAKIKEVHKMGMMVMRTKVL